MNWITPMEPIICKEVKRGTDYVHEIKWDGIRGLVYLENNDMKLFTKKGNERTQFYPELSVLQKELSVQDTILDGEIVVLYNSGFPSFHDVLVRETVRSERNLEYYLRNYPVKYMVFDILQYNGKLLTQVPLTQRKEILQSLIEPVANNNSTINISEVFENGSELYDKMKKNNMEGIVSKKVNSLYIGGKKHAEWFKTKFTKKMLCIIGGIQWNGDRPNSLVLGIRNNAQESLSYVGKASIGLKQSDLQLLKQYKNEIIQKKCPFENEKTIKPDITGTGLTWVIPSITCWISFLELSNDGHFRHPKILGFTSLPAVEADGKVLTEQ